jgi:hypothetical protein
MYLHFHIIFFKNLPKNWLILKNGIFGGFFGDFFLYLMHAPLRRSISGNLEQCGSKCHTPLESLNFSSSFNVKFYFFNQIFVNKNIQKKKVRKKIN